MAAVQAAGGTAISKRFDVSIPAEVDAAIRDIAADGGLHILVNNAGIAVNGWCWAAKTLIGSAPSTSI